MCVSLSEHGAFMNHYQVPSSVCTTSWADLFWRQHSREGSQCNYERLSNYKLQRRIQSLLKGCLIRSSHPEVFLVKGVLKICSKFIGQATLLKSHFGIGVLLYIYRIFSEPLLLRTHLDGCFCLILALISPIIMKIISKLISRSITTCLKSYKKKY